MLICIYVCETIIFITCNVLITQLIHITTLKLYIISQYEILYHDSKTY